MYACTSFQWITAAISHFPSKGLLHSSVHTHASDYILTAANLSKRANSSLRVITSSCAVHCDARLVKPSMSANKMLQKHKDKRDRIHSEKPFFSFPEFPVFSILKWFLCWPHFYLKRQKNKILYANKNEQRVSVSTTFHIPAMNFTTNYKSTEIQWKLK